MVKIVCVSKNDKIMAISKISFLVKEYIKKLNELLPV